MAFLVPLPQGVRELLSHNTHPGLLLDKYVLSWDPAAPPGKLSETVQKPTVQEVAKLSQQPPPQFDFLGLLARRRQTLEALGAKLFNCTTTGPLTLHLARASALENAGICLHPLYGFVYLPATGLKGMARAYAETVWLLGLSREEQAHAWRQIEAVFGWAPGSDLLAPRTPKPWKPPNVLERGKDDSACSGCIVFHDAWPVQWPKLVADIVNNHHSDYYDGKGAPGDWEEPNMVAILAVKPGASFLFALSERRVGEAKDLLGLAREWLLGALVHEGAGAKTAAGYGCFQPVDIETPPLNSPARATSSTTLELITPAFLAGANQKPDDCELRPATLRGQLRWWWRTMHAGFVDVATLRKMEATVWGDTNAGGAVRLTVRPLGELTPLPYDKKFIAQKNALLTSPNNKTTQGLWYHTYGMDEQKGRRSFLAPGARWSLSLSARQSYYPSDLERKKTTAVGAQVILEQAEAALWLLCHFGGVGSKSRRGFGCFADPAEPGDMDLQRCGEAAERYRQACGLRGSAFQASRAESPSLQQMLPSSAIPTFWKNYWMALDQVGNVAQEFAQFWKHDLQKKALGLPRNVRPPFKGAFRSGAGVQRTGRHAAPVFYHLARNQDGNYVVRITAFPALQLPDLATSQTFLQMLLVHFQAKLPQRVLDHKGKGPMPPQNPGSPTGTPAAVETLTAGSRVEAVVAEDPKGKGRPFARHMGTSRIGPIINPNDMPADQKDKQIGDKVTLILHSISSDGKQIQFRWPTPADSRPKAARGQGSPPRRGGPRGRPNRR